ncbi:sensor histidine kinase [Actinomadura craniellae]|uniref:sensor histidine kinase n=1 Tax=Actinomadura craniellae TaxID=2231787 RepID=UPI0018F1CB01|nr:ATP-binding protein [Actinomadura craniellae]
MSARARIVGWVMLVATLALSVSGVATWSILLARLEDRVNAELANETEKLRAYATRGPGRFAPTVADLLTGYLEVTVPDGNETYFSLVDGRAARRSGVEPPARLDDDRALVARLAVARTPVAGWTDSAVGRVRYAVVPVRVTGDSRRGALVVAVFYDRQRDEVDDAIMVLAGTAFLALCVAGLAGWLVAGRVLAPVRLVRLTAERIGGSSDLSRRLAVTGDDDIAALAGTFNRMLDRLDRAFTSQRQFLDDVGHELRTPITVVRGHLELMGDADREETLALVTDELDRMKRMVDDLMLLARSGQPGFLALGQVVLADLTVDVLAKARALGERTWRLDEVAEGVVVADGQRLTQALMQLIANAVRHTGAGDVIAVGSAVRAGEVVLWVRDGGPGVPAAERERIFDRFARGDTAGAGLGLAIVGSIAEAHGGRAAVRDAPGGGALFELFLRVPWRAE